MTSAAVIWAGFAVVGAILVSILGAVHRREKFAFVGGVLLVIVGQTVGLGSGLAGAALGLLGIAVALAATVPLLRQSATIG